jgi:hypothetical protein
VDAAIFPGGQLLGAGEVPLTRGASTAAASADRLSGPSLCREAMLLTTLKFVAFMWLGLLLAGVIFLAVGCLFRVSARVIRQRLARRG